MRSLACAICASFLGFAACAPSATDDANEAESASTANRVNCDVRLDKLDANHLAGIRIEEPTPYPIAPVDKYRHLNELNRTSKDFLGVLRAKNIPIKLTGGTITSFHELAGLSGQVPRGWEGKGLTWDSVPGLGNATGIYLGNPAYPNNAWSLAVHESSHGVDASIGLSEKSATLINLYRAELARPATPQDPNAAYRRVDIHEFFAVAVDEYYCSGWTQARLAYYYPQMYEYVRSQLDADLRDVLNR